MNEPAMSPSDAHANKSPYVRRDVPITPINTSDEPDTYAKRHAKPSAITAAYPALTGCTITRR